MRSVLRACSLLALLGAATQAHALGLGDADVRSDLSSPLLIEIPIVGLAGSGVGVDEIRAAVPGVAEQAALGSPDPILPRGARVRVVAADGGGARVRITTERASREPVLRFVLRASWSGGTTLRRYELIVDPPAVALPRPRLKEPLFVRATPSTPSSTARLLPPPSGPRTPARAGTRYGPVRAGDTLYAIIAEAYPARAGDPARAAAAIVARNPQAFIGGDPGRVLLGATLELPAADALVSAPTPAAAPAVAAAPPPASGAESHTVRAGDTLYGVVRGATGAEGAALAAAVDRVHAANPQAFLDGDRDRLRVGAVLSLDGVPAAAAAPEAGAVAPAQPAPASAAPAVAAAPPASAASAAPAGGPAVSAEAVASAQAELAALEQVIADEQARETDLTARLDRVLAEASALREREQRLTTETEALRTRLAALAREPLSAGGADAAPQAPAAESVAADAPAADAAAAAGARASADAGTAPASTPPAVRAPAISQPPRQGMPDRVLSALSGAASGSGAFIAAGAAVVLALLALVLVRRRRAEQPPVVDAAARAGEEAAKRRLAELRERHEGASTGDFTDDGEVVRTDARRKVVMTDAAQANKLAKEAAVHMAYGNMEESKACILEAIRLDSGRDEHKMMLITIYESTNEHAKARAIVDDLLKRREELPQDLRAQVERKLESVKAG